MNTSTTPSNKPALLKKEAPTLPDLIKQPQYSDRFKEVLRERAPQFMSSVMQAGNALGKDCDPKSIIASAMTAAILDLPIDRNLGFAWLVPYKAGGTKFAQFQMGYKGYIQLSLRTGSYQRMNALAVNKEVMTGYDEVGEPVLNWNAFDPSKPVVGYAFAWKTINGFQKICFWSKARVEEHAKRYSQSYRSGGESPWKTHFDEMGLKTVIANELRRWGMMSVQIQRAIVMDQAVLRDLDAAPEYIDGSGTTVDIEPPSKPAFAEPATDVGAPSTHVEGAKAGPPPTKAPEQAPVQAQAQPQPQPETAPAAKGPDSTTATPASTSTPQQPSVQEQVRVRMEAGGVAYEAAAKWLKTSGRCENALTFKGYGEWPDEVCKKLLTDKRGINSAIVLHGTKAP